MVLIYIWELNTVNLLQKSLFFKDFRGSSEQTPPFFELYLNCYKSAS